MAPRRHSASTNRDGHAFVAVCFLADYGGRPDYPHVLPDKFKAWGHGAAGVLMLAAFIATAFCTAYIVGREDVKIAPHRRFFQVLYWAIALLMLGTLIFVVSCIKYTPIGRRRFGAL